MEPFISCRVLQDVLQDGVCVRDALIVSQSSGNKNWTVLEVLELGCPRKLWIPSSSHRVVGQSRSRVPVLQAANWPCLA